MTSIFFKSQFLLAAAIVITGLGHHKTNYLLHYLTAK